MSWVFFPARKFLYPTLAGGKKANDTKEATRMLRDTRQTAARWTTIELSENDKKHKSRMPAATIFFLFFRKVDLLFNSLNVFLFV